MRFAVALVVVFTFLPSTLPAQPAQPATAEITTVKQMLVPTLASFECKDVTAREAVDLLGKQFGLSLHPRLETFRAKAEGSITCRHVDAAYWTIFADVCRQGRMEIMNFRAIVRMPFVLEGGNAQIFPIDTHSAVVPTISSTSYGFTGGTRADGVDRDHNLLNVDMVLLTESKVYVAGIDPVVTIDTAVDTVGNNLRVQNRRLIRNGERFQFSEVHEDLFPQVAFPLRNPKKRIRQLKGSVRIQLGFDTVQHDLSKLISGEPVTVKLTKDVEVTFEKLRPFENRYIIDMTVPGAYVAGRNIEDSDAFRGMRLLLSAEDGTLHRQTGQQVHGSRSQRASMMVWFGPPSDGLRKNIAKPNRLTWTIPRRVEEVSIPFEFRDIDLTPPEKKESVGPVGGPQQK